jgi:protein-arginine deiminase
MEPSMKWMHAAVAALLVAGCGDDPSSELPAAALDPNEAEATEPAAGIEEAAPHHGHGIVCDLRADTNRDGVVRFDDPADDLGEDDWTAAHGAVFLANIDDDEEVCPLDAADVDLPKCNDAADEIVNGAADALDLARLATRPWPAAPAGVRAAISFSAGTHVRLFKVQGSQFLPISSGHTLTRAEIQSGVELAIEAKDIVRDRAVWDGFVDITLTVQVGQSRVSDRVRMRVSPIMTFHHLTEPESTWVSAFPDPGNAAMRSDLAKATSLAGVPPVRGIGVSDPWTQDFFETGYMSMPAPNGRQHVIRVALRSANVWEPYNTRNPLRPAGVVAFAMRGKDSAAVQIFDRSHPPAADTLNSFGNWETVPPYTHAGRSYPLGRVLRGSTSRFFPDRSFTRMMDAQRVQPPIELDTSWLLVAHVDETLSFVKANTPRGWVMLANDPTLALDMLVAQSNAGRGNVRMFLGKYWDSWSPAAVTINQVLSDPDVLAASAEAAVEVNAQIAKLKAETGITDAEIIRVPFLHMTVDGASVAYQPATVNGLYLSEGHFVAPDPHGPVISGQDIFKTHLRQALAAVGVTVHFAENWDTYHVNLGEVHCGTNATRKIPNARWWESGR